VCAAASARLVAGATLTLLDAPIVEAAGAAVPASPVGRPSRPL
jgi:hypothetical protein